MNHSKYQQGLGATVVCTKRTTEAKKGIDQKYRKGAAEDCFLFECWFSSKKAAEAVIEVGTEFIGMLKKNIKGFCRLL